MIELFLSKLKLFTRKKRPAHHGWTKFQVRRIDPKTGELGEWKDLSPFKRNVLTLGGRDYFHAQCYTNTVAGGTGANKIGVSNDTTQPPDESHTSMLGEITGSGMDRKVASPAPSHVAGTNVSVMEATWTATGTVNGICKVGTFTLLGPPVAGVLVHENILDPSVSLVNTEQLRAVGTHNLG